ncbi:MAG: hypothetical protein QOG02_2005 [Gaiellales bacterium]|jgi:hypothetical protein|nr:hypothetical protein [Gaiellales bacterium]MDX6538799.1 hypothetical protein [Gaiellales bacterium]MDX6546231.1 hypothetical protein [Gaiellales bacterium]
MKDAFNSWDEVLPVGTKVQITYSNGKHRDGTILEHRPDGLLKLATNPNRTLGAIYYANPAHIAEIEVLGD